MKRLFRVLPPPLSSAAPMCVYGSGTSRACDKPGVHIQRFAASTVDRKPEAHPHIITYAWCAEHWPMPT